MVGAFSATGASPGPAAAPADQQGAAGRRAGDDREVLPVDRRRRRLRVDLPVADRARQRRRRLRPGQLRHPSARHDQRGHVGARLDVGDRGGDVVAGPLGALGHQRLAVDEQPHPPDVDLGQRQHDLRGEQPSGGGVEVAGAGQVDDDRPVRARRDVRPQPGARDQLRHRGPGQPAGRPGEQLVDHPGGLRLGGHARHVPDVRRRRAAAWGRRTRRARCGSRPGRSTAARRRRRAAGRSATGRRGGRRRRPTGTATARARTPRPG